MFNVAQDWNPRQTVLRQALDENRIEDAKIVMRELHSAVHSSEECTRKVVGNFTER